MGKATIKSGGEAGYYGVEIKHDDTRRLAIIARINATLASLESQKVLADAVYAEKQSAWNDLKYRTSPVPTYAELYTATAAMNEADRRVKTIELKIAAQGLALAKYSAISATENLSAWCADLTEDLSGDVGIIEVNGVTIHRIIQPGYEGNAVYQRTRDGITQKTATTVPEAAYWNLAMLPGWQTWKPTYRAGTISNIDTDDDTCTVTLNPATGKQGVNINVENVLNNVPVRYMTCNAAAFESGDEVVVSFTGQSWDDPVVIGFASNPKPCGFTLYLTRGDGATVDDTLGLWIDVYNSAGVWVATTEEWVPPDEAPGYWSIKFDNPADARDTNGYWLEYGCDDSPGGGTQYPARYKDADKRKTADLVRIGAYTDTIPYWRVTLERNMPLDTYMTVLIGESYTTTLRVYSSIPFRTTYGAYEAPDIFRAGLYAPSANWASHISSCLNHVSTPFFPGIGYEGEDTIQINAAGGGVFKRMGASGPGTPTSTIEATVSCSPSVAGQAFVIEVSNHSASDFPLTCYQPPDWHGDFCPARGTYAHAHVGCVVSPYVTGVQASYDY